MRPILLVMLFNLAAGTASAQPGPALPTESVTVIATKPSEETIRNFVETRAAPTRVTGRMARWTRPVCPMTIGLGGKYAKYITQRIRDVAAAVGAPVNEDQGCRPNIEVVFTTTPQPLLDSVRDQQPLFLGYYGNKAETLRVSQVTHPIQSWYTTATIDMDGSRQVDSGRCGGTTISSQVNQVNSGDPMLQTQGPNTLVLPCAIVVHATGSRVHDGLSSGFFNVLAVAEPAKLYDYEVGALADYIAMQVLSQPASLDSCQELPSISNMLARNCTTTPPRITDGDLAYLRALYRAPGGITLSVQRDEMQFQMKKTLVTDKQ